MRIFIKIKLCTFQREIVNSKKVHSTKCQETGKRIDSE